MNTGMRKKVIIVDDDDDILQIVRYILEEQGIDVEAVNDIVSFQKLDQKNTDLILLDDWLNDGYGSELCKTLKSHSNTQNITIILISAANQLVSIANKSGADDFLAKPFDIDDLLTKVDFWLAKHSYEKTS